MSRSTLVCSAGLWLIVGSILGVGVATKEMVMPTPFGTMQNLFMQGLVLVANTLTLVGVVGLARSSAAGYSRLAKAGLGIAIVASALFLPFEVLVTVNQELGGMLLGLSAMVQGFGLLLVGVATLQARRWDGWYRFTPLLCGAYIFVVLIPALSLNDGYSAWALCGWQVTFILLGVALFKQASPIHVSSATARA